MTTSIYNNIDICIKYDSGIFTLATVKFNRKNDIIVYQKGQKSYRNDLHWTYHGNGGESHVKNLKTLPKIIWGRKKQNLDSNFQNHEIIGTQLFCRSDATYLSNLCDSSNQHFLLDADNIQIKVQTNVRHGKYLTYEIPVTGFQVALVHPDRKDLLPQLISPPEVIISQRIFSIPNLFPLCTITIFKTIN